MNTSATEVATSTRMTACGGSMSTEEIRFRIAAMFARDETPTAFGAPNNQTEEIR